MTKWLAVLILAGTAVAQTHTLPAVTPTKPPADGTPVLTFKQQMDVAVAAEKVSVDQAAIQAIPGFKEKAEKVQSDYAALQAMGLQLCISPNGKRYQLDHSTGVWICKEVK